MNIFVSVSVCLLWVLLLWKPWHRSLRDCPSFSPEETLLGGEAAISPAVVVVPKAQPDGVGPAPAVRLHDQAAAVPVGALSPALCRAPRASVGDTLVLIARSGGV